MPHYTTSCSLTGVWKVAKLFSMIWEHVFYDLELERVDTRGTKGLDSVIKSAASVASLGLAGGAPGWRGRLGSPANPKGGCASSRLDHGFQIRSHTIDGYLLQPISGPCSGEIVFSCKWAITTPACLRELTRLGRRLRGKMAVASSRS